MLAVFVSLTFLPFAPVITACTVSERLHCQSSDFGVLTSRGTVVNHIEGMAIGYTNEDLSRLVSAGVAEIYPIRCLAPAEVASPRLQLVWKVNDVGRATAVLYARLLEGEDKSLSKSAFSHITSPEAVPSAVFMASVAQLARKLLPPPPSGLPMRRTNSTQ